MTVVQVRETNKGFTPLIKTAACGGWIASQKGGHYVSPALWTDHLWSTGPASEQHVKHEDRSRLHLCWNPNTPFHFPPDSVGAHEAGLFMQRPSDRRQRSTRQVITGLFRLCSRQNVALSDLSTRIWFCWVFGDASRALCTCNWSFLSSLDLKIGFLTHGYQGCLNPSKAAPCPPRPRRIWLDHSPPELGFTTSFAIIYSCWLAFPCQL